MLNIHLKSPITNRQRRKKVINVNDRNLNEARGSIHRHSIICLTNARDVFLYFPRRLKKKTKKRNQRRRRRRSKVLFLFSSICQRICFLTRISRSWLSHKTTRNRSQPIVFFFMTFDHWSENYPSFLTLNRYLFIPLDQLFKIFFSLNKQWIDIYLLLFGIIFFFFFFGRCFFHPSVHMRFEWLIEFMGNKISYTFLSIHFGVALSPPILIFEDKTNRRICQSNIVNNNNNDDASPWYNVTGWWKSSPFVVYV